MLLLWDVLLRHFRSYTRKSVSLLMATCHFSIQYGHPMASKWLLIISLKQYSFKGILIYSGCRNKIPQIGWLRQQKFIFHCFRGWGSPKSRCWQVGFILRPLLLACRVYHLTWPLSCGSTGSEWGEKESKFFGVSFYKNTDYIRAGPHPHNLF